MSEKILGLALFQDSLTAVVIIKKFGKCSVSGICRISYDQLSNIEKYPESGSDPTISTLSISDSVITDRVISDQIISEPVISDLDRQDKEGSLGSLSENYQRVSAQEDESSYFRWTQNTFDRAVDEVFSILDLKGCSVSAVVLPAQLVCFRSLRVPFRSNSKIRQILPFELSPHLSLSGVDYLSDFIFLDSIYSQESAEKEEDGSLHLPDRADNHILSASLTSDIMEIFFPSLKRRGMQPELVAPQGIALSSVLPPELIERCFSEMPGIEEKSSIRGGSFIRTDTLRKRMLFRKRAQKKESAHGLAGVNGFLIEDGTEGAVISALSGRKVIAVRSFSYPSRLYQPGSCPSGSYSQSSYPSGEKNRESLTDRKEDGTIERKEDRIKDRTDQINPVDRPLNKTLDRTDLINSADKTDKADKTDQNYQSNNDNRKNLEQEINRTSEGLYQRYGVEIDRESYCSISGSGFDISDLAEVEEGVDASSSDIQSLNALSAALCLAERRDCINFCRGDYAKGSIFGKYRKRLITLFLFISVAASAFLIDIRYDIHRLKKKSADVDREIAEVYRSTFPKEKMVVEPLMQMQVKLREAEKQGAFGSADSSFADVRTIDILYELSSRIPESVDLVVTRFLFSDGRVVISGNTDNFNSVDRIKSMIEKYERFQNVTISSAAADKSGSRVSFSFNIDLKRL